jgi:hypothetical protein
MDKNTTQKNHLQLAAECLNASEKRLDQMHKSVDSDVQLIRETNNVINASKIILNKRQPLDECRRMVSIVVSTNHELPEKESP